MRLKKLLLLGLAGCMLVGSTVSVSAAGLRDIFDAEYYADQYPDLKAAFGNDEETLFQHFVNYGLKERRNMNRILDVVTYMDSYEDLQEAFGDNPDLYVNHFFEFGMYEERSEGVAFNPVIYAEAYEDIATAFGTNYLAVAEHYATLGYAENRTEGTCGIYESFAEMIEAQEAEAALEEAETPSDEIETPSQEPVDSWTEVRPGPDGRKWVDEYVDGKLVKITAYLANGDIFAVSTYTYDEEGEQSGLIVEYADGSKSVTEINNNSMITKQYTKDGWLEVVMESTLDDNKAVISSTVYVYAEDGELISTSTTSH